MRVMYAVAILFAGSVGAQERPSVQILASGPEDNSQISGSLLALSPKSPVVMSRGILSSGQIRNLVSNGFPARMHYKLEQWTVGRLFDNLKRTVEWDVVVRFDPLAKSYQVFRVTGALAVVLGEFSDYGAATATAEAPYLTLMPPPKKGQRAYYSLVLDVESLSMTDLNEVERWLRGELKPAIRGDRNPGTAVSRGVSTLFVRLMGGDRRRYEARSGKFTAR